MAGKFVIHPKRLSSITCSLSGETPYSTTNIVDVNSLDLNEKVRDQMVRSGATSKRDVAKIKFVIWVFGNTQEDAMSTARSIRRALSESDGGYIEYRPIGYSDSVMSTWYHYNGNGYVELVDKGAATVQAVSKKFQLSHTSYSGAVRLGCELEVWPWATSEPDSLQTIVSSTSIDNYDDASHDNSVIVPNSAIKGDAVLPVIEISNTGGTMPSGFLMYVRRMYTTNNTNLDIMEGESFSNGSTLSDPDVSNDAYITLTHDEIYRDLPSLDRTYLGKITPMIVARSDGSTSFQPGVNIYLGIVNGASQTVTINASVTLPSTWAMIAFPEIDIPLIPTLERYSESEVGSLVHGHTIKVLANKISGTGALEVDYMVIAKASEWIAMFDSEKDIDSNLTVIIDSTEKTSLLDNTTSFEIYALAKQGSRYEDLILRSGFDYRIRFLFIGSNIASSAYHYYHDTTADVTVKGLYATVYPFEES